MRTTTQQHTLDNTSNAQIRINPPEKGYQLAPGIFGANLEITRKGFFSGLCAQMLNNRKLFMGQESVDGWSCTHFTRVLDHPEESLCQSNYIILMDGGTMSQSSSVIALQTGATYEATVWVKAKSSTATVTFGVAGLEQTMTVEANDAPYQKLSFVFQGIALDEGTFSVTVCGEVAVFEVSLMPTDHFYGMRWDVIEHLRTIAPTTLRFPGGCAADHFAWRESLKSPEFRKPVDGLSKSWFLFRDTYHQDTLDIGLNEFFMLCRELGAEPEYTVSLILSDGNDARDLVEYCNGDVNTEYGARRQALGFDAFNVHLWYIGNEAYFFGGEYQTSSAAANRTNELITAMKEADPSIAVAIGITWGKELQSWAFDFMEHLTAEFDYVSYHDYIGILPDATQGENGLATCEILEENFADGECFGLNFYRNQLFADNFDEIRICVDEWNYSWGKDSSNALFFSNALQFHFIAKGRESYHIERAEFFMPVNEGMMTVRGNLCKMESTGELFRLMAGHKGGHVVECASDNKALDILCTNHEDGLFMSVVNRGNTPIQLNVMGYEVVETTEICVLNYSFESNDYEIRKGKNTIVNGHSLLCLKLTKAPPHS